MRFGSLLAPPASWPITVDSSLHPRFPLQTTLYQLALQWLAEDRDHRRKLEQNGKKTRGAIRAEVCRDYSYLIISLSLLEYQTVPSDSETFYRK